MINGTDYEVIRSRRRTVGAEIKEGKLIVRAPFRMTDREIREFLSKHEKWIETHLAKSEARKRELEKVPKLSPEELQALANEALRVIPQRAAHYAPLVGVTYGRITIRNQRTKWGSCSAKGNLNFNCLLMLTPPEVIDSVVVHELCHLKEMNHSDRFYREVLKVFPDYWKWTRWLKEHEAEIMARMN